MPASLLCRTFLLLRCLVFTTVLTLAGAIAFAQAAGSDYTNDLPSVDKVKAQIQGTDPTDTTARQVAVFEYLQTYIQRIKLNRDYKGPYSPGETKLLTDYAKAQYDLTQSFTKTHTPAEVGKFNQLEGQYSINNALGWIKQLEGQRAADTYKGTEADLAASYKRHEDQLQQQMKQENSAQSGGGLLDGLLAGGGNNNLDPDQKRCLELGGKYNACAGAMMGLLNGLANLISMGAANDSAKEQPPLAGVILVGSYHSRTDLPEIGLSWDGGLLLSKCGTLVDSTHSYTIRKAGATTQIVADNEPDLIVLTLRPDGSLSGPGSISVKGSIITGYHNQYSCTNSTPYTNGNCTTSSTPIYSPSMQRCTLSQLAPQPAPPPPPKPGGLIGSVGDLFGDTGPVATTYGFRMIGPYASSSGMLLSFVNGYVTLDCGQAHVNVPYTIDNTTTGFVVHVQNSGGAFLLGVAPDDTLRGSGSTTVNGRLVSAVNGENVSFTPHSESCNVGTFTPKAKRNTMLATNAPMPAAPSYSASTAATAAAPSASTRPAAAQPTAGQPSADALSAAVGNVANASPSGSRAALRVLLSSSFSGTNPLSGQSVFVTRIPMDQILRELGVAVPAKATPAQAMKALQTQCHSAQGCTTVIQSLSKYYVTAAKLDASGKATLNATASTGPYYFFAVVPSQGGSLVWDVPATLIAGDNNITFTDANSERIQ